MPDEPTIPNATCPPFAGASARDLLAGILLASGGDPANIPNTTQCREWGYGRYTERDLLAAILLATGSGGAEWGLITGTLSDQTDLQTALNGKLGVSAQAADVNPAGTAIAAALGAKLNLAGGTLSGALNFSGTTHAGLRLNNLTTVERDAVASPLAGMVLWNTTQGRMNFHNGSAWTDGFVRLAGDTMTGDLTLTNAAANRSINISSPSGFFSSIAFLSGSNNRWVIEKNNANNLVWSRYNSSGVYVDQPFVMSESTGVANFVNGLATVNLTFGNPGDLFFARRAAASLQLGFDSATPIAQTLGIAAGVGTNIAGANFTIAAGRGTGTGLPGSLLFQTSTVVGSGATAQTLTTRMTLGATDLSMASGIGIQLGNAAVAATPTATHTVTIKDSTGTTYRLLCVV
jgi:hypothetical protein